MHEHMCEYFICFFAQLLLNGGILDATIQKGQVKALWVREAAGFLSFAQVSSHIL